MGDVLYKRSFSLPYLRCLRPSEADYVLREVNEWICGNHLGGRSLAQKVLRQGYYRPSHQEDATALVHRCEKFQRQANLQHKPSAPLSPILSPWPFAQWGMDMIGPFPLATGQRKFRILAIDYFTKSVEAEKIMERKAQNFVWKSIVCRFEVQRILVTDNEFDNSS
jgi:hypothetical protein